MKPMLVLKGTNEVLKIDIHFMVNIARDWDIGYHIPGPALLFHLYFENG